MDYSAKITVPMSITHNRLISSNVPEDPVATEWDVGTTYADGDQVYRDQVNGHRVYESVQSGNTGKNPVTDGGTWWVEVGWTNRWKCLKTNTGQATVAETSASSIQYEFNVSQVCTEIAFRGLKTQRVLVRVYDALSTQIYYGSKDATETIDGVEWYIADMIFTDLPIASDCTVEIVIDTAVGSASAEVGQIIIGFTHSLGRVLGGTVTGFQDFSVKEQDEFGAFTITERGVADTLEFEIDHLTSVSWILRQILLDSRENPCLFWASEELIDWGIFCFGYADEPETIIETNISNTTVEVIGIAYTSYGDVAV